MESIVEKWCSRCKKFLSLPEFGKDKKTKDGLKCWCKSCRSTYQKEYYKKHPEKQKEYRQKNKGKINEYCRKRYHNMPGLKEKRRQQWHDNKEKNKAQLRKRYHDRKISGQCVNCLEMALPNLTVCLKHYFYTVSNSHFSTSKYWQHLMQIAEQQKYICPYSGQQLIPGINMSLDHKLPKSRFPEKQNDLDNLQFCDLYVNNAKHIMTEKEFIIFIDRLYNYIHKNFHNVELTLPISEVIDRITILKLKIEKLPRDDTIAELFGIYDAALYGILKGKSPKFCARINELKQQLYEANKITWNLEFDIRNRSLDNNLSEVGRRAIKIRQSNKIRIGIKNEISKMFGEYHGLDKKIDHLSGE
jgi:hypothetical protein